MQSTRPMSSNLSAARTEPDLSFEDALTQLQDIVTQLEEGSLTLEVAIASFRQGAELAAHCQRMIASAELKITTLASSTGLDEADPAPELPQSPLPGL